MTLGERAGKPVEIRGVLATTQRPELQMFARTEGLSDRNGIVGYPHRYCGDDPDGTGIVTSTQPTWESGTHWA
ncbi:MAG: hypothetical protein ACI855_003401 [Myxococcota bacterium]|jgi:hypothetical protein